MKLKDYEIKMGRKLAVAQTDIKSINFQDSIVVVAKKGDIVKVVQEFDNSYVINCDNWDFDVFVEKTDIKFEEENKMTNLKVGMVVEVELNYGEVTGTVTEVCEGLVNDGFYMEDEKGTMWKFYSDIHKVTILDEALFQNVEGEIMEIVNKDDFKYFDHAYKVSVHMYDNHYFGVYADCEQDALDRVVDYLEEKELTGYFYDQEEREELEKEGHEDIFIVAGNHCHNLDGTQIFIEQVK
jgi:hypothetical protein